jgi:hypothetical protein
MTEESMKQMTWHKKGKRYNADILVHPSDGEAWTRFDGIHCEKENEAVMYMLRWQQMGSICMD